ncbi:unnamed protein product [Lasius platythorax]|uniref:Uncharacterized protein n=1 Tax=Lasius platythorax TaxID=488582 RepID=A0AAV2N3S1_9HYME
MKTKTTGIPFEDYYGANTQLWSYGDNKTATHGVQETRGTENPSSSLLLEFAIARTPNRLRCFPQQFRLKERLFRPAFTTRHIVTLIQLPILPIAPPKFEPPHARYTRS